MAAPASHFPDRSTDLIVGPLQVLYSASFGGLTFSLGFWHELFMRHHADGSKPRLFDLTDEVCPKPDDPLEDPDAPVIDRLRVRLSGTTQPPCFDYCGRRWVPTFKCCDELACDPRAVAIVCALNQGAVAQGIVKIAFVPSNHRLVYSRHTGGVESISSEPFVPIPRVIRELVDIIQAQHARPLDTACLDRLALPDGAPLCAWTARLLRGDSLESIYAGIESAGALERAAHNTHSIL